MGQRNNDPEENEVLEDVCIDQLLPNEDPDDYRHFRRELMEEMDPKTARQRLVAQNVVDIEWDILRHRRFIAGITRIEFCRQASTATGGSLPDSRETPIVRSDLGKLLLKRDAASLRTLASHRVTTEQLTSAAIMMRGEMIAYHESRIADLERRRRSMAADYGLLTSLAATSKDRVAMEDAEVIE